MRTAKTKARKDVPKRNQDLLLQISQLVDAAARESTARKTDQTGTGQPDQERIRGIARTLGKQVATNLKRYWPAALKAAKGPIDVIDVFSGCGGMSAGFLSVNGAVPLFNLVMAIDIDPVANATYSSNFGITPLQTDVSALARNPKALRESLANSGRRPGHPLVLIGCAPCQGFSSHRNGDGPKDQRNSLVVDFARIAGEWNPDAIVIENVPELLTERYWPFVEQSRSILTRAGYSIYVGVHNMAEFGVPQERFRAVMLALPKRFTPPRGFLKRSEFRTVRQAIGGLPKIKAGERHPDDQMHYTAGHHESTLETIRAVPKDGGSRPPDVGPECLRRGAERQGKAMYEDVYGRLYWDRPAITITAYARNPASGRFIHPAQDRGLSVREAALLQAFPPDYEFSGSLDQRFRQIGNAVPPAFASYLACYIIGELLVPNDASGEVSECGILKPVGASFSRIIAALKAGHRKGAALA